MIPNSLSDWLKQHTHFIGYPEPYLPMHIFQGQDGVWIKNQDLSWTLVYTWN